MKTALDVLALFEAQSPQVGNYVNGVPTNTSTTGGKIVAMGPKHCVVDAKYIVGFILVPLANLGKEPVENPRNQYKETEWYYHPGSEKPKFFKTSSEAETIAKRG